MSELYPVYCSWCEAEGVETVLKLVSHKGSHGICRDHADALERELAQIQSERSEKYVEKLEHG